MTAGYRRGRATVAAARAYAGPLLITALITLIVCGGLVGGQRELSTRTTGAFQDYLRQHVSSTRLTVDSQMTAGNAADLDQATGAVPGKLPAPSGAFVSAGWSVTVPQSRGNLPIWLPHEAPETSTVLHQAPSKLTLLTADGIGADVRYTAGAAPACQGACTGTDAGHAVPIAISEATAQSLRVSVGQVYTLASKSGAPLYIRISGLFRASAVNASGPAAELLGGLLSPFEQHSVNSFAVVGEVPYIQWTALALIAPDALSMVTGWQPATVTWDYNLAPERLSADQAVAFATRIKALVATAPAIAVAGDTAAGRGGRGPVFGPLVVVSAVPDVVSGFESDAAAAHALGLFVLVAAGVVGIATILLALRVLFARQERDLALRRARGFAPASAARRAALQAAGCTVPAAAIAIAVSLWAVPGTDDAFVYGVAGVVIVGIPLAAAITALRSSGSGGGASAHPGSSDQTPVSRRTAQRRKALRRTGVVLLLLLLVGAATVVRTELATSASSDLLSASLPTLAAAVGALAVTSVVTLLVRPTVRFASGRTRSAAPFLAAAHAARRPALPAAAAVALLVATSSAVFASCFTASLGAARQLDAGRRTGADLRIDAQGDVGTALDPAALARVAAAPGVRASATGTVLARQPLITPRGSVSTTVVVVDPVEYDKMLATASSDAAALDSPGVAAALRTLDAHAGPDSTGDLPALISPSLAGYFAPGRDQLALAQGTVPIAPVAQADSIPAAGGADVFVVLSRPVLQKAYNGVTPLTTTAWYDLAPGGGNQAVSRAEAIPAVTVTVRSQLAAGLDAGPVGDVARWTSRAAVGFDLVLAAVCLLLAAALTAPTRAAGKAFLATLGARRATGVAASVLETLPAFVMISAVAAAAALGALGVLAPLVGQLAVGSPDGLPLSAVTAPAAAVWAVAAVPVAGLLLAAVRAFVEHRTRLSFLRDERAA
ncbi:MAG TPA: hypothetical protein VFU73_07925 [Actinocrinis sp.]|nr:hypothetical protein [Actinocrinis sp.]